MIKDPEDTRPSPKQPNQPRSCHGDFWTRSLHPMTFNRRRLWMPDSFQASAVSGVWGREVISAVECFRM